MPTYDYKCSECGHTFEESLKIADRDAPTALPCEQQIQQTKHMFTKCGGRVEQIIGVPLFAYDNIKTKHFNKPREVGKLNDRLAEIKSKHPNSNI